MTNETGKRRVISISVIAFFVITGVILFLSLSDFKGDGTKTTDTGVLSDATPGQNNKEVKTEIQPRTIEGTYVEQNDGWTYTLSYAPQGDYHGGFVGSYDQSHETVADNYEKHHTEQGFWKLDNGEVKLYIDSVHVKSLWHCGDYMVDSRNYFVGDVPKDKESFQAAFTCKAGESGDTQVLNFYYDGKMIMEIIRNDGVVDSSVQDALPPYQVAVGTYEIEDNLIITKMIGSSEKVFNIVDDGLAFWVYNKLNV